VAEVIAYRTRAAPPDARALQRALAADAFVVCSPSAAEQLKRHRLPSRRGVVACLGPTTARAARRLGLRVASVASRPTPEALADAVVHALREPRSA
jgi:uroporphyrinogen-III synthase